MNAQHIGYILLFYLSSLLSPLLYPASRENFSTTPTNDPFVQQIGENAYAMAQHPLGMNSYENHYNLLHLVARHCKDDTLATSFAQELLLHGINVNQEDVNQATPLHLLFHSTKGTTSIPLKKNFTETLLQAGAQVLKTDKAGNSIVHLAAQSLDLEIFGLVIRAAITEQQKSITPLKNILNSEKIITKHGLPPVLVTLILNYLIPQGLTAQNYAGETPLHLIFRTTLERKQWILIQEVLIPQSIDRTLISMIKMVLSQDKEYLDDFTSPFSTPSIQNKGESTLTGNKRKNQYESSKTLLELVQEFIQLNHPELQAILELLNRYSKQYFLKPFPCKRLALKREAITKKQRQ